MAKARQLLFALLVSTTIGFGASSAGGAEGASKKAGADDGLRQAFERATYSLQDSGHGIWRGENAAQRLTLEFNAQGAQLSHPDGSVSFHLTGYGYGDRLQAPANATPTAIGNRVEYERGGLTEWYLNGRQGLEQGFTLAQRPETDQKGKPLVIALGVSGDLLPAQEENSGAVVFKSGKVVVLRYAGLKALDARGRILSSRLEVRGDEIRMMVEDRDAQYPLVVDPTWTQQQELLASDGATGDNFGYSVSVNGDTAVIGAGNKTVNSHLGQGAAYVFVRSGGVWTQQQELTASDGAANDGFGFSVTVNGDTAMIGAPGTTVNSHGQQGVAYVFVRSGGVWSQQAELTPSDGATGYQFGYSVQVNGDTAVIGARYATVNSSNQGAAYVFVRSGAVWSQQQKLTAFNGAANDQFGYSVSVDGDTAVIGAFNKAVNSNAGQGVAYVFVRSGAVWSEQWVLTASDGAAQDNLGQSVSVSGDTAMIGAPGRTVSSQSIQGAAYVFVRSITGTWSQQQELTASDGGADDGFGVSVSISGDMAVIGDYGNPVLGAAYVFVRSGGTWSQQQELTASDGVAGDNFGYSVSVSGDTAVIGALNKTIDSLTHLGVAYAFVRPRLGTNALVVGSAGGSSSVVLSYDRAWTATANESFLHLSSGNGSGNGSALIAFTYDAFTGKGTRTGTLTIAGLTVTVTQAGTNYMGPGPVITLVPPGTTPVDDVAVDSNGYVYIADTFHSMIKEWGPSSSLIVAPVSSGLAGPHGVAVDGAGNIYVADTNDNAIKEWNVEEQQLITLASGLDQPFGVAVDVLGNVYIADTGSNAIKEWSASTRQVTTLVSGLNEPFGVAVDVAGNVYIADSSNNVVKEWSASTGEVTTLVSSGLSRPLGVAVDGSGNVYIADTGNNAIKEWSASTGQVTTLLASGLNFPGGVAVDGAGNVYIADNVNQAIKEIPNVFVGPANVTEHASAGSGTLLPVLPSTASLTGFFAPTSDQSWLTIGSITNGAIGFSFSANTSTSPRVAHITVLGQVTSVTQNGLMTQTITFGPLANQPYGTAPFTVSATASSGLIVSFASTTSEVCTVSDSTVTVLAVGTCTIKATQAGDAHYAAAKPVTRGFIVTGAATTLTPATLAFGNQVIKEASPPKTATFENRQAVAVTISSILVTGTNAADFVLSGNCPVSPSKLGPGKSCNITVTFTPSALETETATVTVTHNAPTSPQTVTLTGTGAAPVTLAPATLGFGTVAVGSTSAAKTVTLTNHQNTVLSFSKIAATAGFKLAGNTCGTSVAAGTTCTVGVKFAPTKTGAVTGALKFTDSASNSPQTVALSGTGN